MKLLDLKDKLFVKGNFACVPTDSESLNEALGGGLRTDNLYVIQAPSGFGKTTLLMRLALKALFAGEKVMYISAGEQDAVEIAERMACMYWKLPYADLKESYDPEMVKECENIYKFEENLFINYSDDPMLEKYDKDGKVYNDMGVFLDEAKRNDIKFIFFDYLGSCIADTVDSTYAYLTHISGKLKNYCTDNHVCIVTAMQTNRGLKQELRKDRLDLSSIDETFMADSIGPARKASACMSFVEYEGKKYIILYKNRLNGKLAVVNIEMEKNSYKWKEFFNPEYGF